MLDHMLPDAIKDQIRAIPIPLNTAAEDQLIWNESSSDIFTVKGAYQKLQPPPTITRNTVGWSWIWKAECQERIRTFLWQLTHNKIMTNVERWRTHTSNTNLCPRCRTHEETIFHLLRDCSFATQVWSNLIPPNIPFFNDHRPSWFKTQTLNSAHHSIGTASWSHIFLNGIWQLAVAFQSDPFRIQRQARFIKWIPPEAPFFKINTDGAFRSNSGIYTAGGLIRNHNGSWVKGFVRSIGQSSIFQAELWGILEGLHLALNMGIDNVIIEADSLAAVNSLKNPVHESHPSWALISNCKDIMSRFTTYHIHHVLREGNRSADYLAATACEYTAGTTILESPPSGLVPFLEDDINGAPSLRL